MEPISLHVSSFVPPPAIETSSASDEADKDAQKLHRNLICLCDVFNLSDADLKPESGREEGMMLLLAPGGTGVMLLAALLM